MILRGIDFGPVHAASGAMGFFGEGYWFHTLGHPFGLDFGKVTLVGKTGTLDPNKGNLPLKADHTPLALFPDCIVARANGATLNAVGLSNPGYPALLATGKWQGLVRPFFLSFMAIRKTKDERMAEYEAFVRMLKAELPSFRAKVGLQANFSCPNTEHDPMEFAAEIEEAMDILAHLGIPIVPKVNVDFPVAQAAALGRHRATDALCISNALPWASLPEQVKLEEFGTTVSPLAKYGGGGYSGQHLYMRVLRWIVDARAAGYQKPFVAGGGIRNTWQAHQLKGVAGKGSAIFLGSIGMTRGWRVRRTAQAGAAQ